MKKAVRIGIAIVCMVALVFGYYTYLANRNASASAKDKSDLSEVEAILSKDFVNDYPATPRAVVKWYNRIISAYYDQDYSKDELEEMADQARMLLDDDLLELNPRDAYLVSLMAEIEDYNNRSRVIVSSSVCGSNEVIYKTVNGHDCAYVTSNYFIREGSTYDRTYEEYCLRKDEDGKWKILTWQLSQKEDTNGF